MDWKKFLLMSIVIVVLMISAIACSISDEPSVSEPIMEKVYSVENGEWKITIVKVEEHGTEFSQDGITVWTYEEASHFFFVQIKLEHLNGEDIGTAFLSKAVVLDNKGNAYDWWWAGAPGNYFEYKDKAVGSVELAQSSVENHFIFVIPDGSKIVEFEWPGLSRLEISVD